jgi:hypothetical protein
LVDSWWSHRVWLWWLTLRGDLGRFGRTLPRNLTFGLKLIVHTLLEVYPRDVGAGRNKACKRQVDEGEAYAVKVLDTVVVQSRFEKYLRFLETSKVTLGCR